MAFPLPTQDSTALITGASSGIGAEIARELAGRGYNVTLVARRKEKLEELAAELQTTHGITANVIASDITDEEARDKLPADIAALGKHVDVLVNNAGRGIAGNFHQLDPSQPMAEIQLNIVALVAITGAFLPGMVERGSGAVLNVGSVAGFQPIPRQGTYAATKAFVNSFSEALHTELHGTGVTCTVLCPGPVKTEFFGPESNMAGVTDDVSGFVWMTAADTAKAAVDGLVRGKRTVVPGALNKLSSIGGQHTPRSLLMPLMRKFYPVHGGQE